MHWVSPSKELLELEGPPVAADSTVEVAAERKGLEKLADRTEVAAGHTATAEVPLGSAAAVEEGIRYQLGAAGTGKHWRLEEQIGSG